MASSTRLLAVSRAVSRHSAARSFSTSSALKQEAAANLGTVQVQKKPIGGLRGGVVGFLFGFSLASSLAAYHLLEEYQQASAALQASVEELKLSTEKVTAHVRRIETVEKDLKALKDVSPSHEDVSRLRAEYKKLYDGLHIEFLDLRSHVWGIQQDLHKLSKKESTSVRI